MSDGVSENSLASRLNAARDRHFRGRSAELAQFRAALTGEPGELDEAGSCSVLFFHGPGGIGKSTLLRRFAVEARAAGRMVVGIDARSIEPSPAVFEAEAAAVLTEPGVVLLVDTFEQCRGLEVWLRESFLPRLPADALVVLAGRYAPELEWRSDPGWSDVLRVIQMQNLPPEDAKAMLTARGVPEHLHQPMLTFTAGHPLTLSLAAELNSHTTDSTLSWAPTPDVVELLLQQLIGDLPSTEHRYALEVCAHARFTTEDLLRAAKVDNADAMFAWLRTLAFIESSPHGLYPHDVVRDNIDADLRWRDPQRYETMHRLLRKHLLTRAQAAQGAKVLPAMGDLNYLRGHGGKMPELYKGGPDGEVFEDTYHPADRPAILKLAAEPQGPFSAELIEFWLDRQPEAFFVHRRSDTGELIAFMACLNFAHPEDDEIATDPVIAAAWSHCQTTGPLRPGELLAVVRFDSAEHQLPTTVDALIMQRILATIMGTEHLAWTFLTRAEPERYETCMDYVDHHLVSAKSADMNQGFGVFAHDWRAVPVEAWFDVMEPWELFGLEPRPQNHAEQLTVLSRPDFDIAVRDALRASRNRRLLAANPLIRARIVIQSSAVSGSTETHDPIKVLERLLAQAVDYLRDDPGETNLHRVLTATYFEQATTQEAAAEHLLLPFSTYRRHLKLAHKRVSDILWYREMHGPSSE